MTTRSAYSPFLRPLPRRVAVLSVHTSPLEQPGTGDAGGMNVYILQTALRMARRGVNVEIFTRATSSDLPPVVDVTAGVRVRHVVAGPFEELDKSELPAQLCSFTADVLRTEAFHEQGYYDVVHSHYWLSGQVGTLTCGRWGVPLVHTAHTLAKVKNAALAGGDTPEPMARVVGEQEVVDSSDRLVANSDVEAAQLVQLYGADPDRVLIVPPGVDLERFTPTSRAQLLASRQVLGVPPDAVVLAFVGRIQPLKAPDVLLRAAAEMVARDPGLARRLVVLVVGGASGSGIAQPMALHELAARLGIRELVRFLPAMPPAALANVYRAADVVAVPSHNESFGLVALEAQACGTPVVAAAVGGLPRAVDDGVSGRLVAGHDPGRWASTLAEVALVPGLRDELSAGAVRHAARFSWDRTTDRLLAGYVQAATAFRTAVGEVAV